MRKTHHITQTQLSKEIKTNQAISKRERSNNERVSGYKDLCSELGINSKSGNPDADRKRFYRMAKKYGFPVHRNGSRVYMFKEDIYAINNYYLLGTSKVAKYIGISTNTFNKWLQRYPEMPVDREKEIAFTPDLDMWHFNLKFERFKREGYPSRNILLLLKCRFDETNYQSPSIIEGMIDILESLERLGLSKPKSLQHHQERAFKKYQILNKSES